LALPAVNSVAVIDPKLAEDRKQQPAETPVSVIVILRDQVNPGSINGRDRAERQRNLIQALRDKSDHTQGGLRTAQRGTGCGTGAVVHPAVDLQCRCADGRSV
jgi:hypothetical protein